MSKRLPARPAVPSAGPKAPVQAPKKPPSKTGKAAMANEASHLQAAEENKHGMAVAKVSYPKPGSSVRTEKPAAIPKPLANPREQPTLKPAQPPGAVVAKPPSKRPGMRGPPAGGVNQGAPFNVPEYQEVATLECQYCHRKFNPESLSKHENVCLEGPGHKKRKVFDSSKNRVISSEQRVFVGQSKRTETKKKPEKKAPGKQGKGMALWKIQSAQFQSAMKAARGGNPSSHQTVSAEEAVYAAQAAGFIKCPTCGRSFNETAAKRHLPFCASKTHDQQLRMPQRGLKKR